MTSVLSTVRSLSVSLSLSLSLSVCARVGGAACVSLERRLSHWLLGQET